MQTFSTLSYTAPCPTVVALGCFDGVHPGHAAVIGTAKALARDLGLPCLVWAFAQPPRNFFAPGSVPLLTSEQEKSARIEALGADLFGSVPFDKTVAALSAEDFMESILRCRLQARHIVCGYNYSFGAGGTGNTALLQEFCHRHRIGLTVADPVLREGSPVSSSAIRAAIAEGNMEEAAALLGRPYSLTARVIRGQRLAHTLGFPTLNQPLTPGLVTPRFGVYLSKISGLGELRYGITNIGCRPTAFEHTPCAETHIFDFSGDLYGKTLTVSLLSFLRPETLFPSLDALRAQVDADIRQAKERLPFEHA